MNYQDIPFLIWAENRKIGEAIKSVLGRKLNTVIETGSLESFGDYLQKAQGFHCVVLHLSNNKNQLEDIVDYTLKKCPAAAVIIFSFKIITLAEYQNFIREGVADVLIYDETVDQVTFLEGLLRILNQRWSLHRCLERGKKKMYEATVVTAYHEINQALTVIINAVGLLKLEIEHESIDLAKMEKISDFIVKGTNRIEEILDKLKRIKEPVLKEYTPGVAMVCLDTSAAVAKVPEKAGEMLSKDKLNGD
jgi:hypothetical protein